VVVEVAFIPKSSLVTVPRMGWGVNQALGIGKDALVGSAHPRKTLFTGA